MRIKFNKSLSKIVLVVLLIVFVGSVGLNTVFSADAIKIGYMGFFTGPFSPNWLELRRGMDMAVDEINEEGGIKGRTIEVIYSDTPDEQILLSEARRLIEKEKVAILITGYPNGGMIIGHITERNKVPLILDGADMAKIPLQQNYKYAFRMIPNTEAEGVAQAEWLCERLLPTLNIKPE